MALRKHFEELENLISASAELAKIRPKLYSLCEHAEAAEMDVQRLNAEAHRYKRTIEEYERKIEKLEKQVGNPDEVDGDGFKFLILLFDQARALPIEEIARALGLAKPEAEYHRDVLLKKQMIWKKGEGYSGYSGYSGSGESRSSYDLYDLTEKGRAYVVKHR
jgi:hypothetical protein